MSGLKPPRRKRRIYQQLDSPFPIPIESVTKKPAASHRWFYYTGVLRQNCVLVVQQGDVIFLHKMGFFGKGMLSKSKPEHNVYLNSYQGLRKKNLPPKERRFQQQRFQQVRKHRYERHLSWSKQFIRQARRLTTDGDEDNLSTSQSSRSQQQEEEGGCTQSDDITAGTDDATSRTDDVRARMDVIAATDDVIKRIDDVTVRTEDVTARTDDVIARPDDVVAGPDDATTINDDVTTTTENGESSKSAIHFESTNLVDDTLSKFSQSNAADNTQVPSSLQNTEGEDPMEETEDQSLIRKEDPYPIQEYLQLKLEEAFFLSYGLGCLTVLDENKKALDLTEMWQAFCSRQRNFVASYVAYHYYRSKGWVPRDGLKYGADFVLYKHGPPFYHGSYSVVVRAVTAASRDCSAASPRLTWPAVSGMDRITETVAKEVVFCHVIRPSGLSEEDMKSPRCVPQFKVQEILMKRCVLSRERDAKDQPPPLIS